MKPLHDDATMRVIKAVMLAADARISREEMTSRLIDLNENDLSMSTWSALQHSWQNNWISSDEFERIINGGGV